MTLPTDPLRARTAHLDRITERKLALQRAYQQRKKARLRQQRPPDTAEQQAALERLKERWNG